jgi:glycosyltransferase involved in cell wall biosynthesis
MGLRRLEIELSDPQGPVQLGDDETGLGLIARWRDRLVGFAIVPFPPGARVAAETLAEVLDERFAGALLAQRARAELEARTPAAELSPAPTLSVVICTKDRAARLGRLLDSLTAVRAEAPFSRLEVLVVDNAPSDDATRRVAEARAWTRYVLEPKPGLDFARNAALHAATGQLIAYLDDDVVVDAGWLKGLFAAWRSAPDAGGYTGLVLPYRLDTEAQADFERRGGFGRGFQLTEFRQRRYGNRLHPVGAGILGAGCNMCFDRKLLLALGGFDEALDTGAPLPGGGDLDIFYRVLRSGRSMLYEPAYAVYHEHRETLPQLERQYWTWGLGFMAFLDKSRRSDPELAGRQAAMVWWWICDRVAAIGRAAVQRRRRDLAFAWAEFLGGIQGLFGEYDRSLRRSQKIREGGA